VSGIVKMLFCFRSKPGPSAHIEPGMNNDRSDPLNTGGARQYPNQ
jgi:hypothetical protein